MCGLHLVINAVPGYHTKIEDFFKDAFLANQVRGTHATGMFTIGHHDRRIDVTKKAIPASDFVVSSTGRMAVTQAARSLVAVGHVRHATQGAAGADTNAHPFLVTREDGSRVVGVHNGTLQGWRNKEGSTGVDVDSAWAFKTIAREGPVDAFEYFNGAFAMIWYDSRQPDTLFIARNDQRPFHFMMTEDGKHVLGASEAGMLGWIAERNGYKIGANPGNNIFFPQPGKVYKFDLKNVGGYTAYDYPAYDPSTTKTPPPAPVTPLVPSGHRSYRNSMFDDWDYDDRTGIYTPSQAGGYWGSQSRVLKNVKDALKKVRYVDSLAAAVNDVLDTESELVEQSNYDSAGDFDTQLDRVLDEQEQTENSFRELDAWGLVGEVIKISKPNDRNCTQQEIAAARKASQYGQVVAFIGVLFDEDTAELYGEYHMWEGNRQVQYDAVIRGLSSKYAEAKYVNSNSPVALSIVGRLAEGAAIGGGPLMVLSELDDGAKQLVASKLAKLTAKAQ